MAYGTNQKKQKYMIWVFMAVLVITGTVLYFGFFKDKITFGTISIPAFNTGNIGIVQKSIDIDFSILDSEEFKNLTPFEDVSPFEGKVGREDPFKPNQ